MNKGLLIYHPEDYAKNKWFVNELLTKAASYHLSLQLVLTTELVLGIHEEGLFAQHLPSNTFLSNYQFVINRSRDSLIGSHFEQMGMRVFNSAYVTALCNHKGRTHQFINRHEIPSVPTWLGNKHYSDLTRLSLPYPIILKSIGGHGGSEVFMLSDSQSLLTQVDALKQDDFILQTPCSCPGVDIRVFTLGRQIIRAVKRYNPHSFKSNYSLGGTATLYELKPAEEALVQKILHLLDFDLVGIDFILDQDGNFLFNEIEDVVGTRTLYLNAPDIDIVCLYLQYIVQYLS